jgi:hypothetical protein
MFLSVVCLLLSTAVAVHAVRVSRIEPGLCSGEVECKPLVPMGLPFDVVADLDDVVPGTPFVLELQPVVPGPPFESLIIGTPYVTGAVFRFSLSALGAVPGDYRFVFKFGDAQFAGGAFTLVYNACTATTKLPRRTRSVDKRQSGSVGCLLAGGAVSGTCRTQAGCRDSTAIPNGPFATGCAQNGAATFCCANNRLTPWGACSSPGGRAGRCIDEAACWTNPAAKGNNACNEWPASVRCCPPEPEPSTERPLRGVCVSTAEWCANRLRGSLVGDDLNATTVATSLAIASACPAKLMCCVDAFVAKPNPAPPLSAPLAFEQPKNPVRMPYLLGSLAYVSWSGGGAADVTFDTIELVQALDLTQAVNLSRVDVRVGSARVLLEHPDATASIAPSMYRFRLRGVLSDPFIVGAQVCNGTITGICVEQVLCNALAPANWTNVPGECPAKTVCCTNQRMFGTLFRDTQRALVQPTLPLQSTAPPSLSILFVASNGTNSTALPFLATANGEAAVAGGVIAGLLVCCLLVALIVCIMRGRRHDGRDDHVIAGNKLYHAHSDKDVAMDAIFAGSTLKGDSFSTMRPIPAPGDSVGATMRDDDGGLQPVYTTHHSFPSVVIPAAYAHGASNRSAAGYPKDQLVPQYPHQPSPRELTPVYATQAPPAGPVYTIGATATALPDVSLGAYSSQGAPGYSSLPDHAIKPHS